MIQVIAATLFIALVIVCSVCAAIGWKIADLYAYEIQKEQLSRRARLGLEDLA